MTTQKKQFLIIFVMMLIAAIFLGLHYTSEKKKDSEIKELKQKLAHAQILQPVVRDTIRDSIIVNESPVVLATLRQIKEEQMADRELIKDLGIKMKQLESIQKTVMETKDTVKATYSEPKQEYTYHDQWADLSLRVKDSTFYYNIRDSIEAMVFREYKHRFLWFRWGTKGYKLKMINFNPHASVKYNTYISVDK